MMSERHFMTPDEFVRFWAKVDICDPSGCWIWKGCKRDGYGLLSINGSHKSAHRLSYMHYCGAIRGDDLVCHTCDNPACVNPSHLFSATHTMNMKDMREKGRSPTNTRGEGNRGSKLTQGDVDHIRSIYRRGGISQSKIAKQYGVAPNTISAICNYRTWSSRALLDE